MSGNRSSNANTPSRRAMVASSTMVWYHGDTSSLPACKTLRVTPNTAFTLAKGKVINNAAAEPPNTIATEGMSTKSIKPMKPPPYMMEPQINSTPDYHANQCRQIHVARLFECVCWSH